MSGNNPASAGNKKQSGNTYNNTYEAIKGNSNSRVQNTADTFNKISSGFLDQLTGNYNEQGNFERPSQEQAKKKSGPNKEFSIFNFQEYHETSIVRRQIKELTEQIKREIILIKKADKSLSSEIKDIEKLSVESLPEKPGIYHVRFLEIVLNILRLIKSKINESNTWLQAMISRKKKRGSLFASRAKNKGTQYSLSDELKITRQTG